MEQQDFTQVVEKYTDYVYNICYRIMGNPHDAEDAVQETFLSAYRSWDRFRRDAQVSTWLYRIAVNACLMRLRKDKKSRQLTEIGLDDRDVASWDLPERAALSGELQTKLQEGLALLPEEMRVAVVLRDVEQLSNEEAAAVLNVSVSAFKARLHRGRVLLRRHLDQYIRS
ncbi:MAG: sigma-70 family RNA polymerase sigma factor [Chloroflexi bacterium]|nr:sigma-70 family RNA polymerase sigma factor [Chloroflexota bacterium]